ncbi:MAG: OB-fold nucleic acid binding domain-containing protein, partial [Pseudomonadota bacterium]
KTLLESREHGPFRDVQDLSGRTGLERRDLECLAAADALAGLSGNRHRAFWAVSGTEKPTPLFSTPAAEETMPLLPTPREGVNIIADYASVGLTLRRHPLSLLRERLARRGIRTAEEIQKIRNGAVARAAGLVICRQRPLTASGVTFVTLEDETGQVNLVVWPKIALAQRKALLRSTLLAVTGVVQRDEPGGHPDGAGPSRISEGAGGEHSAVIHLVAGKLDDLSAWLGRLEYQNRDFR